MKAGVVAPAIVCLSMLACEPTLPNDFQSLMQLMNSNNETTSVAASNKLSKTYGKDGLLIVLKDGRPQAQLMATRWLSRFPAPDVERAMSDVVLLNRDRSLRIGALWTLSEIGTVSALPAVDQAMQDPDASVAGMARDVANSIRGRARDAGNR